MANANNIKGIKNSLNKIKVVLMNYRYEIDRFISDNIYEKLLKEINNINKTNNSKLFALGFYVAINILEENLMLLKAEAHLFNSGMGASTVIERCYCELIKEMVCDIIIMEDFCVE